MTRIKPSPARPNAGRIRTLAALTMALGTLVVLVAGLRTLAAPARALTPPSDTGAVADGAPDVPSFPADCDPGAGDAGLSVIKEATPDPAPSGTRLTYTIRLTNTGATGLHVAITDTLPASVTLAETSGDVVILPNDRSGVTWTVDVPTPGTWSQTVAVTVADLYEGPLTNVVRVTSDEGPGATYTETSTAIILRPVILPLIFRNGAPVATITGEYLRVENPCTTDPCLPGLIYAVLVKDRSYYPTAEGSWLWRNRSWDGYTPELGDIVRVTGYVSELVDMVGDTFYNVEVVSLEPATTLPPATSNVVITDLVAYGAGGRYLGEYVEIRNLDAEPVPLENWTLNNTVSRVFTFPDHLIQPGQLCRIYTDEDHPEWCGFNIGSTAVWNDAQDCAYLRDDEGTLADATCYCNWHTATMTMSATATTLRVGEPVMVTATLFNRGCTALGLPLYRLDVQSDETEPIFAPSRPEPVYHHLAIGSGQSDAAGFALQAVRSGQAVLRATSSFEVHLGYPGPAYWSGSSTGPLTITVAP